MNQSTLPKPGPSAAVEESSVAEPGGSFRGILKS